MPGKAGGRSLSLGCSRCGASATVAILEEYHRRAEAEEKGAANAVAGSKAHIGAGGY